MKKSIDFGIISLPFSSWEEQKRRWIHVEELGFDSVYVADHFCMYDRPTTPWFEGWTLLAALANVTKSIKVGTLVTSVFLRHPTMLARQAMNVDHISNGRLILGLGTGLPGTVEFPMVGIPDYSPKERVARFKEAVEIIENLLTNQVIEKFEGEYYQLENTHVFPEPIQQPRPPIMIGAMGNKMLRIAAEKADIWNSYGGMGLESKEMFEATMKRKDKILEICEEIGRDPKSLKHSLLIYGEEAFSIFDKVDNFTNFVEKYAAEDFDEMIFYYPGKEHLQKIMEEVAKEIIPTFK